MKLFELDLFTLHDKPEKLHGHHEADDVVPDRIMKLAQKNKKLTPKQEDVIAKNTDDAYSYATFILKKPWPKGEDAIAKDAEYSYWYAYQILKKKRFLKGEHSIAKRPELSYAYARDVIEGPFPEGEDAIAQKGNASLGYAILINSRFLKGEKAIAKDPYLKEKYEKLFGVKL